MAIPEPAGGIDLFKIAGVADNVTAFVVASVVIGRLVQARYEKTLGSRRKTAANLRAVTCGNPLTYVEKVFGEPTYKEALSTAIMSTVDDREGRLEKRLYNARHGWLTVHYFEETVVAFAFTLTDPRFKFDLREPSRQMFAGVLGRSSLAKINPDGPLNVECFAGAYSVGYSETAEFGRNGLYQAYGLSVTSDGWAEFGESIVALGSLSIGKYSEFQVEPNDEELNKLKVYRGNTAPDTFAVFGDSYRYHMLTALAASGTFDWDSMMRLAADGPVGWRSWARPSWRTRFLQAIRSKLARDGRPKESE